MENIDFATINVRAEGFDEGLLKIGPGNQELLLELARYALADTSEALRSLYTIASLCGGTNVVFTLNESEYAWVAEEQGWKKSAGYVDQDAVASQIWDEE